MAEWQDRGGPGQQVAAQTVHRVEELEKEDSGALAGSLHPPRLPKPWGVPQGAHFVVGPREASQGQWQLGSDWETPRTAPICLLARDPMIGPSTGDQAQHRRVSERRRQGEGLKAPAFLEGTGGTREGSAA